MSIQTRLTIVPDEPAAPTAADIVRDQIALRSQRMDARFPHAVDLEAAVVAGMHEELRGVAALLAGTHAPEHFRETLRGERSFHLGDLCRLATDPTREAKAATVAALTLLARAVGQSLQPIAAHPGSLVESAITAATIATEALGDVTRAVSDGAVDPSEAASLRSRAGDLRHAAAQLEGAVIAAEGRR